MNDMRETDSAEPAGGANGYQLIISAPASQLRCGMPGMFVQTRSMLRSMLPNTAVVIVRGRAPSAPARASV